MKKNLFVSIAFSVVFIILLIGTVVFYENQDDSYGRIIRNQFDMSNGSIKEFDYISSDRSKEYNKEKSVVIPEKTGVYQFEIYIDTNQYNNIKYFSLRKNGKNWAVSSANGRYSSLSSIVEVKEGDELEMYVDCNFNIHVNTAKILWTKID